MTQSEYQELIRFLAKKFDRMDDRLTRAEVGQEELRHDLQIVAEGVRANGVRIDRNAERLDRNAALIEANGVRITSLENQLGAA